MFWLTKFTIIGVDFDLPDQRPDQGVGVGGIDTSIFTPLPSGGVFDNYGSDDAPIASQVMQFKGSISRLAMTATELESYEKDLRSIVGKRGSLYRKWDNSADEQWIDARCISSNPRRTLNNLNSLEVDLAFQIIGKVWNGDAISESFTKAEITAASGVVSVSNNGNAIQDDVIITITGSGSDITSVVIKKTSASGATILNHLTWSGTLSASQELVIDTGAYTVEKQGIDDYDNFDLGASHREDPWFRLWASANRIEVTITGGDSSASIKFEGYDGWK